MADDQIKLSLTTQQVKDLPMPVTNRYLTVERKEEEEAGEGGS